jgi:hypothetical protein
MTAQVPDKRKNSTVQNIFYGTPDWLIAHWCCISVPQSALLKRGKRQPGPQSQKLFLLHRQGRVLGQEWRDWKVRGDLLIDPEGNALTQGQIRAYQHVYALCYELLNDRPEERTRLDSTLDLLVGNGTISLI